MKYLIFVVLSLFLVSGCAHTPPTSSINIGGLWKGESNNPMGGPPTRLAFNFIQDGDRIVGAMRNETIQGEWEKLENFKIKRNSIYFTFSPKIAKGKMTLKYRGKIDGDKINMSYKLKDPAKAAGGDGGFDASEKVGRSGMFEVSKNTARVNFTVEFTLTRVQQ